MTSLDFAEYLRDSGFLDTLLRGSPLRYGSPNAPEPADVMGSLLVAVMDGLSRYAGINELRRDRVCPELLGFGRIVSEDSIRNGLKQVAERPDEWKAWLRGLLSTICGASSLGSSARKRIVRRRHPARPFSM